MLLGVRADVLLDQGRDRGLADVVVEVDAGIDQQVQLVGGPACPLQAEAGGGAGKLHRPERRFGCRRGCLNDRAHSVPPAHRA